MMASPPTQKPGSPETYRILGIETSCDETAAAVVENGRVILSNVVASQVDLHAQFGGVFPEVASRQHVRVIYPVIEQSLQQAHLRLQDVDAIAVTRGPGLPGSLVVGMNIAKGLTLSTDYRHSLNHLESHLYSLVIFGRRHHPSSALPGINCVRWSYRAGSDAEPVIERLVEH
jgi:N6-L-threonylcarbamoyladenine synthase